MELSPMVVLAGKYIILNTLYSTDYFHVYLSKAPSLGEEFVIIEFFPVNEATRDEDDFVTMSPDNADDFESKLNKFNSDCQKVMRMPINRFLNIREILPEKGTVYVITKKMSGMPLIQFNLDKPQGFSLNDAVFDNLYESIKQCFDAGIAFDINPDNIYVDNLGSFMVMFYYLFEFDQKEIIMNMAKLFYFMVTSHPFEEGYYPDRIAEDSKYTAIVKGALEGNEDYYDFEYINKIVESKSKNKGDNVPVKVYIKSAVFLIIVLLLIIAGVTFGIYQLVNFVLN